MTFSFFLSIYSRCDAPASWAARHTTVCLDHGVARRLLGPHDTLPCVLISFNNNGNKGRQQYCSHLLVTTFDFQPFNPNHFKKAIPHCIFVPYWLIITAWISFLFLMLAYSTLKLVYYLYQSLF